MTTPACVQQRIRQLDRQGLGRKEISRKLGVSRTTVVRYANHGDYSPRPSNTARPGRSLVDDGYAAIVDGWPTANPRMPVKQRHTATRVYERLVAGCGFTGSYSSARRWIRRWRREHRAQSDGFAELERAPGRPGLPANPFEAENASRAESKRRRPLGQAGFPRNKTLDGYDWSMASFPSDRGRERLESPEFVERAEDPVLYGDVGRGETHPAIAIGVLARQRMIPVRFFTAFEPGHATGKGQGRGQAGRRNLDFTRICEKGNSLRNSPSTQKNRMRRRATLPHPSECSTIAAPGLSFRVRNGTGRLTWAMTAAKTTTRDQPPHKKKRGPVPADGPWTVREPDNGREQNAIPTTAS